MIIKPESKFILVRIILSDAGFSAIAMCVYKANCDHGEGYRDRIGPIVNPPCIDERKTLVSSKPNLSRREAPSI
jgi:hypothetical protein